PSILGNPIHIINHFWSLSVEEHFYLLYPIWFKYLKGKILSLSIILIIAITGLKGTLILTGNGDSVIVTIMNTYRFHVFLILAFDSYFYFYRNKFVIFIAQNVIFQIISYSSILLLIINKFYPLFEVKDDIICVFATLLIINLCSNPKP